VAKRRQAAEIPRLPPMQTCRKGQTGDEGLRQYGQDLVFHTC